MKPSRSADEHTPKSSAPRLSYLGAAYGVLLNLKSHWNSLRSAMDAAPYNAPPRAPILYIKTPNTFAVHGCTVTIPAGFETVAVGASLGVVIGKTATRIAADKFMEYIAGFTSAADIHLSHESYYRPAIKERCRDGFLPLGPSLGHIQKADEVNIVTYINGARTAAFSTTEFIRPLAALMADITDFMTLYPGDILLTGSMPNTPLVRTGDCVRIEIDGLDPLEFSLAAASGATAC